VEVIPGASALNACAALVGAPLTHDFCSISLSDLLTPWPVIAKRLEAAGRADFVVALYNPKSGRRTQQIVEAQAILLRHRSPETPVAVVKSGYRRRQAIHITTLKDMADCDIGMLCTVLIGNSATFVREGLIITPRGYANKYDRLSGETKTGEQAGRSLSMGLSGWHACVRKYIREQPQLSLRDFATYFDTTLAEILVALSAAPPEETPGEYRATALPPDAIEQVLEAARAWGRLRAIVRSEGGATAELLLTAADFVRRGDWLNLVNEHFHLHVDFGKINRAWFLNCGERQNGVYFCDRHGNAVFSLLLVKHDQTYHADELTAFNQTAEQFGQPYVHVTETLEAETEADE
jgi:precorrin-3B C17-methyltransferase